MKQNDWLVAKLNNPTFDTQDFQYISGMNMDNTQFLPESEYTKSSFITQNEAFKDKEGNFDQELFDKVYQEAAQTFQEFSTEDAVNNYEYSMWDTLRPANGNVKDNNFKISREVNPQHISIGIAGINEVSGSNKSQRELAQNSKIYDPATGEFLDKTVNDVSLFENPAEYFKSIFGDPLVYATYDEDTTEIDPTTGKEVLHKKGEWKVNDQGEYYTEKLNGRSLVGKQVVSALDYLTSETSDINKYDFFDSDDLDKSVTGSVAKSVAAVLPLFFSPISGVYSGLLVAREMAKSLPMLYGMVTGLSGSEDINSELLNTIAAYGETFSGSTSDYAQQKTFSFENFANLMSDVALQWGQQKQIVKTFQKLSSGGKRAIDSAVARSQAEYVKQAKRVISEGKLSPEELLSFTGTTKSKEVGQLLKTGKWADTVFGKAAQNKYLPTAQKILEARNKMGQDLSLVYMAIVSNTDVYESVLEKGGTPFEAAAIALGSTIGMFSVDKYLHLGEMFFENEASRTALRNIVKAGADEVVKTTETQVAKNQTRKGIIGLIQKGINSGREAISKYSSSIKDGTLGFFGKSLGEGLEEVSEELVTDFSKSLGELAGQLGYFSQTDYGAWENMLDRYAMSFFGGAAGGGLFYAIDAVQNGAHKNTEEFENNLIYFISNGRKQDVINEIDNLYKKNKLVDKNLSIKKDSNNLTTTESENESLAKNVRDTLIKVVDQLDLIMNDNNINVSEDELFDKMVQGEYRNIAMSDFLKWDKEKIKGISYITNYQQDFRKVAKQIVDKEAEIQSLLSSTPDTAKRNDEFKEKLEKLKAEKQELLNYKEYLFGEGSLGYVEKMLFAIDPKLSGQFLALNYDQFVRQLLSGKSVGELTEAELSQVNKMWEAYKLTRKEDLDEAFRLYKQMESKVNPSVQEIADNVAEQQKTAQKFIDEFDKFPRINEDTQLEGESDKDFNDRNIKRENEEDEAFKKRQEDRRKRVNEQQRQKLSEWISNISALSLDRNQFRLVSSQIGVLKKEIAKRIIRTFGIPNQPELTTKIWNLIEQSDLTNIDELKEKIKATLSESIKEKYNKQLGPRQGYDYEFDTIAAELEAIGQPVPMVGSDRSYITYGDVFKLLQAKTEEINSDYDGDVQKYLETVAELDFKNTSNPQTQANNDFLAWYTLAQHDDSILSSKFTEPLEITTNYINTLTNNEVNHWFNEAEFPETTDKGIVSQIDKITDNFKNDSLIAALNKLENRAFTVNPVVKVIDAISKLSTNKDVNIEEFLESLYEQYQNGENASSFQLINDQQEKILKQFIKDLQMAQAFIHAASVSTSYRNPIGHNKSVNQFIKNHSKIYKTELQLPEISEDYANFLINEIASFITEAQSWINLSQANTANKTKKFIISEERYNAAVADFYKINRDAFKLNPDIDLLDGYDNITDTSSALGVAKTEQLLHDNYLKALNKGYTIEAILDILLPKITDINELSKQLTSQLDENIDYSKLTNYDKLRLVVTAFAESPKQFYNKLLKFISENGNIAPLSIQEKVEQAVSAQQNDPELINSVLQYLQKKLKINIPILENTTVVLGINGAGKSAVIAKFVGDADTWVSGPKNAQIERLVSPEHLPNATGKNKEELMSLILGSSSKYEEFKNSLKKDADGAWSSDGSFCTKVNGLNGSVTAVLNDEVDVVETDDAPKYLVIDEATHFNTVELQMISKWAKLNDVRVLLLGDDHQNEALYLNLMKNLNTEGCLTWRTPKLFISLRDNNVQEMNSLKFILGLVDMLQNGFDTRTDKEVASKIFDEVILNNGFSYYNKEVFKGKMIADELTSEIIEKLNGRIGFIGTSDSENYKKLQAAGKNPILTDPTSVQGDEFDYTIVDKDWELKEYTSPELMKFLKDLCTMVGRSRSGTILINRGELEKFHSIENDFTGTFSIKDAIDTFRESRIPTLQTIANSLEEAKIEEPKKDDTKKDDELEPKKDDEEESEPEPESKKEPESIVIPAPRKKELKQETEQMEDNSKFNEEEIAESEAEQEEAVITNTPIRVYGNVTYSGINTKNESWVKNDSNKDLGIFLKPSDIVKDAKEKDNLVRKLVQAKCLFCYGLRPDKSGKLKVVKSLYDRCPKEFTDKFDKKAIENAKFFINIEDANDNNRLVGLTDLKQEDRAFTIGSTKKVVTLVAQIRDNDRVTYEITLGGFANPETWNKNLEEIKKAIDKAIKRRPSRKSELEAYLKNLPANISNYKSVLEQYIKSLGKDSKLQIELDKMPNFQGSTTIIKHKSGLLRLGDPDPNSSIKPYAGVTKYSVRSTPRVIANKDVDRLGIDKVHVGKSVMFISGNALLKSDELEDLYIAQKEAYNDPNKENPIPQVRMLLLNNLGVAFESLYRKEYKDLYTTVHGTGINKTAYYFPMDATPTSTRMYISMWNFRANLTWFLEMYQDFLNKNRLTEEDVIKLCKYENQLYNDYRIKSGIKFPDEQTYRKSLKPEEINALKPLWDFNDSLNKIRQFRLGWSDLNGAYLRKLTNLKSDSPYGKDGAIGIYINPDLARQYKQVLDNLFNNVLNKIVPAGATANIKTHIDYELPKDWVNSIIKNKKITIPIEDYDEKLNKSIKSTGTLEVAENQSIGAILPIMTQVAKFLNYKTLDDNDYFKEYLQSGDPRYDIFIGDEKINWWDIDEPFKDRIVDKSSKVHKDLQVGYVPYDVGGAIDKRMINLFNLMFHGLTSTVRFNEFTKDEIRATDAEFKYGFFIDPVLAPKTKQNNVFAKVTTNEKLFAANAYAGISLIGVALPGNGTKTTTTKKTNKKETVVKKPETTISPVTTTKSVSKVEQLKNVGIYLNTEQIEQLNNNTLDIVTLLNEHIAKQWDTTAMTKKVKDLFDQKIYSYSIDKDGNLNIITKKQVIEQHAGAPISKVKVTGKTLTVETANGNIYIVTNKKITFNGNPVEYEAPETVPEITPETISSTETSAVPFDGKVPQTNGEFKQKAFKIIDYFTTDSGLTKDDADSLKTKISNIIKTDNGLLAKPSLGKIITQIQEAIKATDLRDKYKDEEYNALITQIRNELISVC